MFKKLDLIRLTFLALLLVVGYELPARSDAYTYVQNGTLIESQSSLPTAGGTTSLLFSSATNLEFTGTLAETAKLPSALSLPNGRRFNVTNSSTGLVTVQDYGGTTLVILPAGSSSSFVLKTRLTSAGTWQYASVPVLNSQTQLTQSFATGTDGTDFGISSSGGVHTFNLPSASHTARGLLTSADWDTFNAKAPTAAPTFTGVTTIDGDLLTPQDADTSTGTVTALANAGKTSIRLTAASAVTLSGIANGANGKILTVVNTTGNPLTVKNADSGASAANRIATGTAADMVVGDGGAVLLQYDATASLWRVTGGSGGMAGTLGISGGGTGQTSKTPAFDALAPTTTKGDTIVHNGTNNVREAVGADGATIVADAASVTGRSWRNTSGNFVTNSKAATDATTGVTASNLTAIRSMYTFTVTAANATVGATYTNNSQTFTVAATIAGGTVLRTTTTGAPSASGTLTKASGTGDATITFSVAADKRIGGVASFALTAPTHTASLTWDINPLDADVTGNCEADLTYMGDGSKWAFEIMDSTGTNVVSPVVPLVNSSSAFITQPLNYPCGAYKLRVVSTASSPAEINAGVGFGKATNVGSADNVNWIPFTMVIGGSTTAPTKATSPTIDEARYNCQGKKLTIEYTYAHSSNTGAADGSGTYLFNLPTGFAIDTTVLTPAGSPISGRSTVGAASGYTTWGYVAAYSSTALFLLLGNDTAAQTAVGSAFASMTGANVRHSFSATVPVSSCPTQTSMTVDQQIDYTGNVSSWASACPANTIPATNKTIGISSGDYQGGKYYRLYSYLWDVAGTGAGTPYLISHAKGASAAADWAAGYTIAINYSTNQLFMRQAGSTAILGQYQVFADAGVYGTANGTALNACTGGCTYAVPWKSSSGDSWSGGTLNTNETRPNNVAVNYCINYNGVAPQPILTGMFSPDYVSAASSGFTNWPCSSAAFCDVSTIALTPGTWEISGYLNTYNNGTTAGGVVRFGIGTTTGDVGPTEELSVLLPTTSGTRGLQTLMPTQLVVASPTTYRLKGKCDTASCATNFQAAWRISAWKRSN